MQHCGTPEDFDECPLTAVHIILYHIPWSSREIGQAVNCRCCTFCAAQVSGEKQFFAEMVVDAVSCLDPEIMDLSLLGIKKVCVM